MGKFDFYFWILFQIICIIIVSHRLIKLIGENKNDNENKK